ncbi:transporter, partial [Xanthomonas citri]|uniref:transporter n=5 Tax=Xanthomonas citri TaxID=346 RepID=UPI001F5B1F1B
HGDDLAVGKAGLLHGTSSGKGTRKFHFWRLLMRGGITFLVNVFGAPALTAQEFRTWEAGAYLTASLAVTGPTGSYDRDAILNLGKNRWSYKPQLAYGVPLAEGTLLAVNGNVQFYGDADNPGESALEQKPLYGLDMHLSTNVGSRMWLSIDANYAHGGRTGSGGIWKDNGQRTLRWA